MVARRIRVGTAASIQTIYDLALTDDFGDIGAAYTFRNVIPITGNNLGRVRVTFKNASTGNFIVDHASVGVWDAAAGGGDIANTLSTPNELLFSGLSGFTIAAGNELTSDWVATTDNFTSSDSLVVIFDLNASGAYLSLKPGSALVRFARFKQATASYNDLNTPSGSGSANNTYCTIKIETGP